MSKGMRTEDEVRDSAKLVLGFDKTEDGVQQGTGQITTFNQLGFTLVIVVTVSLLLVLYFILSFICTAIKGQMSKIFDTKLKKAIAITISDIIKFKENERNAIEQEQIKTTICTNIALLQNT